MIDALFLTSIYIASVIVAWIVERRYIKATGDIQDYYILRTVIPFFNIVNAIFTVAETPTNRDFAKRFFAIKDDCPCVDKIGYSDADCDLCGGTGENKEGTK